MNLRNFIIFALSLLTLAACSGAAFFIANAPVHFGKDRIFSDIPYDRAESLHLNVYLPAPRSADNAGKKSDVIIFFYGGRWESGSNAQYAFVADTFTRHGFIVVIPDYRLYPEVKFPAFVEDGAKAAAWVLDHIGDYGGDKNRVFIAGHSAGAYIGAMLLADKHYLRAEHHDASEIKAFAGLAGPYDFTPKDADLRDIFGPPENYPAMRVTSFIDGREPPMLLLWGARDSTVERYNLDRLKDKIAAAHGKVTVKIYPGLDHIGILGALSWIKRGDAPVADDVESFFRTGTVKP